ncbi:uncharacterized protein At5g39570-like isoform X1 [Musa acuminata AAA Group]|uniref:uncharacterized protein At5g39570-like isoform X1 n=1 Tax=Musa acuminata AAA Group TaxID=214697 RepID=UPI0031D42AAA
MPPSAGRPDDFNEDDFEEYNPHPYLGGYDIALTYGDPLPPSSATCYPISSSASPPSEQTTPPPPHATTPTFDHGLPEKYQPEPFPSPDLFRSWPYSTWEDRQIYHGDAEAGGGWNGWRRALDYLFGHAQGYGEMRVGVDSDGIPIYANKKLGGAESVVVEVEPAPVQRLEFYHPDSRAASCYGETTEERHGYENPVLAYNKHYSEGALPVAIDPNESVWHQKLSHHEAYRDQAFDERDHVTAFFGGAAVAYDRHHYEQPLHLQVEPIETARSRRSSCSEEVYQESTCSKSDWKNSMSYYDDRDNESSFFASSSFAYDRYSHKPSDHVELEPFKPTWPQNTGYYEVYENEESPKLNWNSMLIGDEGDKTTISEAPSYSIQSQYYEQAQSAQLEPYKATWSQWPSYYEAHNEHGSDWHLDPFPNFSE